MFTEKTCGMMIVLGLVMASSLAEGKSPSAAAVDEATVQRLAGEVRDRGWIVFAAHSEKGDWDLFLCRPDGTDRRPLTNTRELNEAGARFSPDGKRLLYYRMPKSEGVGNNTYGTFELVVADSDGRNPTLYGSEFPWASWGPDGKRNKRNTRMNTRPRDAILASALLAITSTLVSCGQPSAARRPRPTI